jgi:hypothetical protein
VSTPTSGAAYFFDAPTLDNVVKGATETVMDLTSTAIPPAYNGANFIKGLTPMTGARPIVKDVRLQLHCALVGGVWVEPTGPCNK